MLKKETRLSARTGSTSVVGVISDTGTLSVEMLQGPKGPLRFESANEVAELVSTLDAVLAAAASIPPLAVAVV